MGGGIHNRYFTSDKSVKCDELIIKTQLFSPIATVLSKVEKGQVLTIKLLTSAGPCVALHNEDIAGTIISKDLLQLIHCMNKGQKYIAVVRSISGGTCTITIKAIQKKLTK